MKSNIVDGARSIYRGMCGALVCWFLFVGAYFVQYSQGILDHFVPILLKITHFVFSVAEVGMVLSIVTILIGLTDVAGWSSRLSKVRFWYFLRLLMYLALGASEVILMVQSPESLVSTNPLQKYHTFFVAGYVVEFSAMVLSNLFAGRNLLDGYSETMKTYGAGEDLLRKTKQVRRCLTVACSGEVGTFLLIALKTRSVYISELSGLLRTGFHDGWNGAIHLTLGAVFLAFLILRSLAEVNMLSISRRAWLSLRELSE